MKKLLLMLLAPLMLLGVVSAIEVANPAPAAASDCSTPTWTGPHGHPYVRQAFWHAVTNSSGYAIGSRKGCMTVGLAPGSNPLGKWKLQISVQDTEDVGFASAVANWTDAGSSRVQALPLGWGSWGEAYTITPYRYAADAGSFDWRPQDANGYQTFVSQEFNTSVNGSPYSWKLRPVVQSYFQPCATCAWVWTERALYTFYIDANA